MFRILLILNLCKKGNIFLLNDRILLFNWQHNFHIRTQFLKYFAAVSHIIDIITNKI